jgi:hypothetical protein
MTYLSRHSNDRRGAREQCLGARAAGVATENPKSIRDVRSNLRQVHWGLFDSQTEDIITSAFHNCYNHVWIYSTYCQRKTPVTSSDA